jgi:cytochrome b6-f complex iron-sulfur subunit
VGIALLIIGLLVLAVIAVLATARQRSTTGRLSRETRKSDRSTAAIEEVVPESSESVAEETQEARARADEARRAIESGAPIGEELEPSAAKAPVKYVPVDEEELGVTRRQFFNRSIVAMFGLGLTGFGAAVLAFLWPGVSGGFGSKIRVGKLEDILSQIADTREPFYVPEGRFYLNPYPTAAVGKAESVYSPAVIPGMEAGIVALYQKCVHLGCRVPWCITSQWFECPCHGSKYNRVGEKKAGPAPRGLDRFPVDATGGTVVVDTGLVIQGPPIGTNTTGQEAEGPACINASGAEH